MKRSFLLFTALFAFFLAAGCAKTIHYAPESAYANYKSKPTPARQLTPADRLLIENAFIPDSTAIEEKTSDSLRAEETRNDSSKMPE